MASVTNLDDYRLPRSLRSPATFELLTFSPKHRSEEILSRLAEKTLSALGNLAFQAKEAATEVVNENMYAVAAHLAVGSVKAITVVYQAIDGLKGPASEPFIHDSTMNISHEDL